MLTLFRNLNSRLAEKRFARLVRRNTMLTPDRLSSLASLAQRLEDERIPGDVVECGVYRGGSAALLDLVRKLSEGYDICITPDGPRGPRYSLGPGAVLLAQLCKVPLMPLLIEYSSYWRLKSWDGFAIPKPFSKVEVTIMPFIEIAPTLGDGKFEAERLRIQSIMTERLRMR